MSHYVHSVPGRLRVKAPAFKKRPENAEAASAVLGALEGIHSVEANPTTGSLLIRYDDNLLRPTRIIGALVAEGLIEHAPSLRRSSKTLQSTSAVSWRRLADGLSEALPDLLADLIAEKVARRAAVALVSAVI